MIEIIREENWDDTKEKKLPKLLQPGGVCGVRQGQPRCCEDG